MLIWQSGGHGIVLMRQLLHSSMKVQRHTHTHKTHRHKHSPDVYLSVAEQFLCQSSADTDRQYGVEDACHKREKPEWNDRLSRHPSPPLPPPLTVPKHLTHRSLDCYDKPDTCQSYTHKQAGEDSSIHGSTCYSRAPLTSLYHSSTHSACTGSAATLWHSWSGALLFLTWLCSI